MDPNTKKSLSPEKSESTSRRGFLSASSSLAMVSGLVASYGTLAALACRYLYIDESNSAWQYVATIDQIEPDEAIVYESPIGAKVVIARQGQGTTSDDFIALSNICPHLGCQVHWEPHNDRFFCPCHNGVFDPQGNPVSGPPKLAGQLLTRFELKVEGQ